MNKPKHLLKNSILFIAAFALSGCVLLGIDDSDDECSKNKRDLIERSFTPSIMVVYSDYKPFSGKATFSIHKVYCDGRTNGKFTESGTTDINGKWNIGYKYTYKFEHPDDAVIVKIDITGTDSDGLVLTDSKTHTYNYYSVENQSKINMEDDYVIALTWPSTQ